MKSLNLILTLFLLSSVFFFTGCDDDEKETGNGQLNVKLTDAPIDDANVEAAFVTVAEVWMDGEMVEGFSKQTIELTAYQQGDAVLLISDTVGAGAYNNVALTLDLEEDQWGNSPGCYVVTEGAARHNLAASSESTIKVELEKTFTVASEGNTDLVIDFDLRKAIKYDNSFDATSDYSFVTDTELKAALRAVVESNSGMIKGEITESSATGDELVVYAYKKGEFDEETETTGQGASAVFFANAVASAKVDANGGYQLSFLEEGDYELHIAAYENDANEKPVFRNMVAASAIGSATGLDNITVEADAEVSLDINITGLLEI